MGNNNLGKTEKATRVGQLIAGTKKHFTNVNQQVTIEGASTTVGAALTELQSVVDNRTAVVTAQAAARTAVATETAAMPALDAFVTAFIGFIKLQLGTTPAILADFGIPTPKVKTPMTAEQKAVAAAKREATRKARGTTGSKAKKAVHGSITAQLVVTPAVDGAEAPATPATAPAASAQGGAPVAPVKA